MFLVFNQICFCFAICFFLSLTPPIPPLFVIHAFTHSIIYLFSAHLCHSWYSWQALHLHRWHRCGHTGDTGHLTGTCPWHTPAHSGPHLEPCGRQKHPNHFFSCNTTKSTDMNYVYADELNSFTSQRVTYGRVKQMKLSVLTQREEKEGWAWLVKLCGSFKLCWQCGSGDCNVSCSTTLLQTEISEQLFNGLPLNFWYIHSCFTCFMVHR